MSSDLLRTIRTGMPVVDSGNEEIGTVAWVKFGDDDPATPEPEATTISPIEAGADAHSPLERIAAAFRADDLPQEVRERLLLQGFVRIDTDRLLDADRYITPDQIAEVTGDIVVLNVRKDDLLQRP